MPKPVLDYTGIDSGVSGKLADIRNNLITTQDIFELYNLIRSDSDFSSEIVLDEIGKVLTGASLGKYFYQSLSIEELAFLITNNRYQEALTQGTSAHIDVEGRFENKQLFLVSEHEDLPNKIMGTIQDVMKDNPEKTFRLSSYVISFDAHVERSRRLYILEEEIPGPKDSDTVAQAAFYIEKKLGDEVSKETIEEFLTSASERFIYGLMHNQRIRTLENYLASWCKLKKSLTTNRDILVNIDSNIIRDESVPEKRIQLWLPAENFQNNYIAINRIFDKRGIPFTRQYFETFQIGLKRYVVFSTYISDDLINPEVETFITNALYSRSVLYQSAPVPVGEIKTILDELKKSTLEEKLDFITIMQQNKQKEYLIPLVALLNDNEDVVQKKAFDLIRHYLFTPTVDMKNDYYWATLFNILAASTVPVVGDNKGYKRPLNHHELIRLIRFRDIFYEDYTEPESEKEFLFMRMSGIGIGKGGIRADADHVSFSGEGALSTNMLFKSLGLGIPLYTTGKGGILGALGQGAARDNVLKAYADFLYYKAELGPLSDVPAGDIGVGAEEIGIIYKRVTDNAMSDAQRLSRGELDQQSPEAVILREHFGINTLDESLIRVLGENRDRLENYTAAAITGKPGVRGLKLRTGATARGLKEVLAVIKSYGTFNDISLWSNRDRIHEALDADATFYATAHSNMKMLTVSAQGFGKVGANFAGMMDAIGARVTSISDRSGTLFNKRGIKHIDKLTELCKDGKFLLQNTPDNILDDSIFTLADTTRPLTAVADVVVPSALEEVITLNEKSGANHIHARQIQGDYILQGANGPATPDAEEMMQSMGIIPIPDILANSGGVLGSYLEWLNGLISQFGYGKIHSWGFVHPIVDSLVDVYHSDEDKEKLKEMNIELYDYAFRFILRAATTKTIFMAYRNKISLRTAYTAIGIAAASSEGRLTPEFADRIEDMRNRFSSFNMA